MRKVILQNTSSWALNFSNSSTPFSFKQLKTRMMWGLRKCCFRNGRDSLWQGHPLTMKLTHSRCTPWFSQCLSYIRFKSEPVLSIWRELCAAGCGFPLCYENLPYSSACRRLTPLRYDGRSNVRKGYAGSWERGRVDVKWRSLVHQGALFSLDVFLWCCLTFRWLYQQWVAVGRICLPIFLSAPSAPGYCDQWVAQPVIRRTSWGRHSWWLAHHCRAESIC